jgi:hypothetical protein
VHNQTKGNNFHQHFDDENRDEDIVENTKHLEVSSASWDPIK